MSKWPRKLNSTPYKENCRNWQTLAFNYLAASISPEFGRYDWIFEISALECIWCDVFEQVDVEHLIASFICFLGGEKVATRKVIRILFGTLHVLLELVMSILWELQPRKWYVKGVVMGYMANIELLGKNHLFEKQGKYFKEYPFQNLPSHVPHIKYRTVITYHIKWW